MVHPNSIVPGARPTPDAASEFTADLAWERAQEQAAITWRAGDPITPTRLWATALEIAQKRFGRGDPRLASSLTNNALVLRRRRQDYQAKRMLADALDAWDDSWRWIHLMTPDRAPGGGGRTDQLNVYRHDERAWLEALARQGRAATEALERYDRLPPSALEEWFALKPKRMSDLRKLLGAVLLIAPRPRA